MIQTRNPWSGVMVSAGKHYSTGLWGAVMTTEILEPREAAIVDRGSRYDSELASLVRRWIAAGGRSQERGRRGPVLKLAPPLIEVDDDADDLVEVGDPLPESPFVAPEPPTVMPALPLRRTGAQAEQATRIAVLIDGRRVSGEVASGLVAQLAGRGTVAVCRAYADWRRSDLGSWVERMRREGLHSFHQYDDDDDQALVAMALDAVDIARDASVDEVVLAGDLTSMLPLVHRLHAAGVRVVAVGAAHTPHDVRAACHEFIDTASIDGSVVALQGRHRA